MSARDNIKPTLSPVILPKLITVPLPPRAVPPPLPPIVSAHEHADVTFTDAEILQASAPPPLPRDVQRVVRYTESQILEVAWFSEGETVVDDEVYNQLHDHRLVAHRSHEDLRAHVEGLETKVISRYALKLSNGSTAPRHSGQHPIVRRGSARKSPSGIIASLSESLRQVDVASAIRSARFSRATLIGSGGGIVVLILALLLSFGERSGTSTPPSAASNHSNASDASLHVADASTSIKRNRVDKKVTRRMIKQRLNRRSKLLRQAARVKSAPRKSQHAMALR